MQSRKDFAQSQRSSNIFDEEDHNTINSPNHGRSKPKDAYREALQMQMESDKQLRDYYRAHEDDHPLEMRVERVSLKKNRDVGGVEGEQAFYDNDGQEFFIGADERNKRGQQKQVARNYASQLEEDIQLTRMREQVADDNDYGYSNRKPYQRAHSPVAPEDEGFFIGQDEVAEKAKKKQKAIEFYRSERERLGNQPSPTKGGARRRELQQLQNGGEDLSGFNIGRDEKESLREQARMKVQYRQELDEQKDVEERMKMMKAQKDRASDLQMSKQKAPYSRY